MLLETVGHRKVMVNTIGEARDRNRTNGDTMEENIMKTGATGPLQNKARKDRQKGTLTTKNRHRRSYEQM